MFVASNSGVLSIIDLNKNVIKTHIIPY